MSDALDYLMKIRPDAMRSYFDFLKSSGNHLEPKTRALISVITKVDNQTETGLKQYLRRALDSGATANEIIDALFAAFPTLGLSKIVWAIDIILKMNLPEFEIENLETQSDWHDVVDTEKINFNAPVFIDLDSKSLMIYRTDSEYLVYDAHCPHKNNILTADGCLGNEISCPFHGWRFNMITGQCIERGNRPLLKYDAREENGRLLVFW